MLMHIHLERRANRKVFQKKKDSQSERSIERWKHTGVFKLAATKPCSMEIETPDHLWS